MKPTFLDSMAVAVATIYQQLAPFHVEETRVEIMPPLSQSDKTWLLTLAADKYLRTGVRCLVWFPVLT